MTRRPQNTRDRLTQTAARLFQRSGYNGVGLTEILTEAQAPKGSLYHHFPKGKQDLALAAASWASDGMRDMIAAAFNDAQDFRAGVTTLCHRIAKLFDSSPQWETCPIAATLFESPDNRAFRDHADRLYESWIDEVRDHAKRFGIPQPDMAADTLFIVMQGGWQLARARRDSNVLRRLPDHVPWDRFQHQD
ncbi:transcriptional regulator, TetR family [Ruegeria lacuscaerulensis ITI-1157]|nr:transcriptional regulator, TetR family [Ruegeria lacuscaerulensis ITI-1157]SHJ53443.1 transcriptional regulator, TetR family [Ruegeria lacuscaerulensis ITI-1157]